MNRIVSPFRIFVIVVLGIISFHLNGFAQSDPTMVVDLKSRKFVPPPLSAANLLSVQKRSLTKNYLDNSIHIGIQFNQVPTEHEQRDLLNLGIQLVEYLPQNAFVASLHSNITAEQLSSHGIRSVFSLDPRDKCSFEISQQTYPSWSRSEKGYVDLIVCYYTDVEMGEAIEELQKSGMQVLRSSEYFHYIMVRVEEQSAEIPATYDWVSWVEASPPPVKETNDGSRASINVDQLQAAPYSLSGTAVRVGVWDAGSIPFIANFQGRLTVVDNVPCATHSSHVAGTLAGDGSGSAGNYLKGMAPAASLYSWDFGGDVPGEMLFGITNYQVVISNNSWATDMGSATSNFGDVFGRYHTTSSQFDQLARNNDFLIVFAAGNDRNQNYYTQYGRPGYRSIPYANGAPSKNTIVVGAVDKADAMTVFSAWGPCEDGRLKPDIVAVGEGVKSTICAGTYGSMNGTSMATPAVTGAIALLIEEYKALHANAMPHADLMKAIILNTAKDLGNAGPDYTYGYGKLDALAAVNTIQQGAFTTASIMQGSTQNYSLDVHGVSTLKVMLAYADREASNGANPALVNNLDIKLIAPDNTNYLPLTLNPASPSALAAAGVNNRDNVEQVVVANPQSGTWTIRVTAPTVPFGPQQYAVTWNINDDYLVAPISGGVAPLYRNDDGATASMALGFTFSFFSVPYTTVNINNNGMLTFGGAGPITDPAEFPVASIPMIAPFWSNVDTRNASSGVVYYRAEPHRFTITWDKVGYYNQQADKVNTFEVTLTDGNDPLVGVGKNVKFRYGDMQWTTGISGGFGNPPGVAGINYGDGVNSILIGTFDHNGADFDGPGGNGDGVNYLDGREYTYDVSGAGGACMWTSSYNNSSVNKVEDMGFKVPTIAKKMSHALAIDNSGNTYVTGYTNNGATKVDYVTIKYDQAGSAVWSAKYNYTTANKDDKAYAITVDNSGNVYVTGESNGGATGVDAATVKYNSFGAEVWTARYNSVFNKRDAAYAIGLSPDQSIVYIGGETDNKGNTKVDYLIVAYDASTGAQLWYNSYNGTGYKTDKAYALAVDPVTGDVVLTGESDGGSSKTDYATVKFKGGVAPTGFPLWTARYDNALKKKDVAVDVTIDASSNVYVTGSSESATKFDYATIKYNSSGTQQWLARYNNTVNKNDYAQAVVVASTGEVFVTGGSEGTVSGKSSKYDFATVKYTSLGAEAWVSRYDNGSKKDDIARSIGLSEPLGAVFVAGSSDKGTTKLDYTTQRINLASGTLVWAGTYSNAKTDIAYNLVVDPASGCVAITGISDAGSPTGQNIVTIKGSASSAIPSFMAPPSMITGERETTPYHFVLHENYPNPFNPVTVIRYQLPREGQATLKVFNVLGQEIATLVNEIQQAGDHSVEFNAGSFASGLYFYKLVAGDYSDVKKMILMR